MKIIELMNWRPVKDYESEYEINQYGQVRSKHQKNQNYIMEQRIDRGGYYTVRLAKQNRKSSTKYVHRLLAFAFIINPENKPMINHKDGNKLNNHLDNLEWVTHSENMKHAYNLGLLLPCKQKKVIDRCSGKIFASIKTTAKFYSIPYSTIKNYLNGNRSNPTCLEYHMAA
jgi:hypothetical protein